MPRAKPTATDTSEPLVITGNEFRKMLGWGSDLFQRDLLRAGWVKTTG